MLTTDKTLMRDQRKGSINFQIDKPMTLFGYLQKCVWVFSYSRYMSLKQLYHLKAYISQGKDSQKCFLGASYNT